MYQGAIGKEIDRYQRLGAEQGRQLLPSQGATSLDQNEAKLEATAKKFVLDEVSGYKKLLAETESNVDAGSHRLRELEAKCEALLSEASFEEEVSNHLSGEHYGLVKQKVRELTHLSELRGFMAEHKISRPAHYPSDYLYHFALIFIAIAIETVVNAFFFENANGLVGGAVVAFAVSVVNLGTAAFFGYFFRFKNHKDEVSKFVGWACLILAVLTSIYLNAVFSAFRAEYASVVDPNSVSENSAAFKNSLSSAASMFYGYVPFADILSFVLFFIGLLLSAFAFYKGYTTDDAYPGYGHKDRLYQMAVKDLETSQTDAHTKLRSLVEARRSELASVKSSLSSENQRIAQIRTTLDAAKNSFRAALQQIQSEYKLVLESYRKANQAVRAIPSPDYFAEIGDVSSDFSSNPEAGVEARIAELTQLFSNVRDKYLDRVSQRLQDLSKSSAQALSTEFQKLMARIKEDAFLEIKGKVAPHPMQTGGA
jgi:hypothetical protein